MRTAMLKVAAAACLSLIAAPAYGVIVGGPSGNNNTNAPTGYQSQWDRVGIIGSASGVYIGNGWVLTANHAGDGGISLNGTYYNTVAGSVRRLANPNGSYADLKLFKLQNDPGMSAVEFGDLSVKPVGTSVLMIGGGIGHSTTLDYYDVVQNSSSNWTWTKLPSSAGADISGYALTGSGQKRWGFNSTVSHQTGSNVPQLTATTDTGTTTFLRTDFLNINYAQATNGDSGGGVFDSQGRLIGIMLNVGVFTSQPANTVMFGQATYFADLSVYLPQIRLITGNIPAIPEPEIGLAVAGVAMLGLRRVRR